jgi:TrmH family RNA methyltransferase
MIITSPDNAKIKLYKKLSEHKKYRDETGLFVLEGERLVSDALKSGVIPEEIFVTEPLSHAFNTPVTHIITETIAKKMASAASPQGIFAVCKKPIYESHKLSDRVIILAGVRDPGNVGTIIRTADALGIKDIISIDSADIYSPKTARAAMGSLFHVNIRQTDKDTARALLSDSEITVYAAVVDENAPAVGNFKFSERAAVMIGNEANGISGELLALADTRITIHMDGGANSLNAAAAASILIWELRRGT